MEEQYRYKTRWSTMTLCEFIPPLRAATCDGIIISVEVCERGANMDAITIMVVDDEYLVRLGIRQTISWEDYGFKVIAEADDGQLGVDMALQYNPDIIITDIRMPLMDGLEFMAKIRQNGLESHIVVLSGYDEFAYAKVAMENGASAYLLKPIENAKLLDTILKIGDEIRQERSMKEYYRRLEGELPTIKNQFLKGVLLGSVTDESVIKEKWTLLSIPLNIEDNFILVIKIDDYDMLLHKMKGNGVAHIKQFIFDNVHELVLSCTGVKGIIVEMAGDELAIILHFDISEQGEVEWLKSRCGDLANRFEMAFSQSISVGISHRYEGVADISKAYREASLAAGYKIFPGISSIRYIDESDEMGYRREIKEAIEYIKNNYQRDITIEMAAHDLYISAFYLMHLFKEQLGRTFGECLIDYRIEMAKKLLKDPKYKIYEVGEMVGYKDPKYFSQLFKKITGMSPSDYIKHETR